MFYHCMIKEVQLKRKGLRETKLDGFPNGTVIELFYRTTKTSPDQGENAAGRSTYSRARVTVHDVLDF